MEIHKGCDSIDNIKLHESRKFYDFCFFSSCAANLVKDLQIILRSINTVSDLSDSHNWVEKNR